MLARLPIFFPSNVFVIFSLELFLNMSFCLCLFHFAILPPPLTPKEERNQPFFDINEQLYFSSPTCDPNVGIFGRAGMNIAAKLKLELTESNPTTTGPKTTIP